MAIKVNLIIAFMVLSSYIIGSDDQLVRITNPIQLTFDKIAYNNAKAIVRKYLPNADHAELSKYESCKSYKELLKRVHADGFDWDLLSPKDVDDLQKIIRRTNIQLLRNANSIDIGNSAVSTTQTIDNSLGIIKSSGIRRKIRRLSKLYTTYCNNNIEFNDHSIFDPYRLDEDLDILKTIENSVNYGRLLCNVNNVVKSAQKKEDLEKCELSLFLSFDDALSFARFNNSTNPKKTTEEIIDFTDRLLNEDLTENLKKLQEATSSTLRTDSLATCLAPNRLLEGSKRSMFKTTNPEELDFATKCYLAKYLRGSVHAEQKINQKINQKLQINAAANFMTCAGAMFAGMSYLVGVYDHAK